VRVGLGLRRLYRGDGLSCGLSEVLRPRVDPHMGIGLRDSSEPVAEAHDTLSSRARGLVPTSDLRDSPFSSHDVANAHTEMTSAT
jgi:hypothetical protein